MLKSFFYWAADRPYRRGAEARLAPDIGAAMGCMGCRCVHRVRLLSSFAEFVSFRGRLCIKNALECAIFGPKKISKMFWERSPSHTPACLVRQRDMRLRLWVHPPSPRSKYHGCAYGSCRTDMQMYLAYTSNQIKSKFICRQAIKTTTQTDSGTQKQNKPL